MSAQFANLDMQLRSDGISVMHLLDRRLIDAAHVETVGTQMRDAATSAPHPRIVVDFEKVEYLSSSMISQLLMLKSTAENAGGGISLTGINAELLKVFKMTGLHKSLNIAKNMDKAVGSLK